MGDEAFQLVGYSVVSRKAATDDGSRSTAEVDVAFGGEVLRGTAAGAGPVDAMQAAVRDALVTIFPVLADVTLVGFTSGLASQAGDSLPPEGAAPVRVTVTAKTPQGESFDGAGTAGDLLHASWLAIGSAYRAVVAGRAPATPTRRDYPSVRDVAPRLVPDLTEDDLAVIKRVETTDWSTTSLDITSGSDRWFAAQAVDVGATLFYAFGNFCAVAGAPRRQAIERINLQKGRPVNQVGSLTTVKSRFPAVFDWDALPDGLSKEVVLALFDAFFALGPMGFRGPAAPAVPRELASYDAEVRTAQLIGPGYRCPSNDLVDAAIGFIGCDYLFVTSANVSSGVTGAVEPAHYDMAGIQRDFGKEEGVVLIGHRDEGAVRASYPQHLPMSTSILAFHKVVDGGLVLERHGSLDVADVAAIVKEFGFDVVLGPGAQERLPTRAAAGGA